MSFKLGNINIGELYVGSNKIAQAYLGSNLVYQSAAPGPTFDSVTIGTQTWLAKNLAIDDGGEGITIVDNVSANGVNFGTQYYYTWDAAVRVANSIEGWHLPTDNECNTLATNVGGSSVAGGKLKSTSGWNNNGNGTDDYGFTVFPVGNQSSGSLINLGERTSFWMTNEYTSTKAYTYYLSWLNGKMGTFNYNKSYGYSVRLIKD